jgi:hypothetical protein
MELYHDCLNTSLVGWQLQSPFQHVQNIPLGGCVAFELQVRKLIAAQSCQGADKLAPLHVEISTEKSNCKRKTKQYDIIKVTIMA